jgi:hypothetical protein
MRVIVIHFLISFAMGCFLSTCRKRQPPEDYGQFVVGGKGDDRNALLTRGAPGENDAAVQLATAPTPLLKGVNFAPADDDDGGGDSEPSVDDDAIEELLRRDHPDGGSD